MTRQTGFELFWKKWNDEFNYQEIQFVKGRIDDRFWSGSAAYKSLKSATALWIVTPTANYGDPVPKQLLGRLYREVRLYRQFRNVVDMNKAFDEAIEAHSRAKNRLLTAERQNPLPQLKSRLRRNAVKLDKEINALKAEREAYWSEALLEEPHVRSKWPIEIVRGPEVRVRAVAPQMLVEWEKILHKVRYSDNLKKRIDMDARFQKRTATIFKLHFQFNPEVPLITISRLIVLVYICADLTMEVNHHLMMVDETGRVGRELTVGAVDQKLRNVSF